MNTLPETGATIVKYLGFGVGAVGFTRVLGMAILSTTESLLRLLRARSVAEDICQLKLTIIRKAKAEADKAEAEATKAGADAQQRMAQAQKAVNQETQDKLRARIAELERQASLLSTAKEEAEARAIAARAEEKKASELRTAIEKLEDAVTRLRMEGGQFCLSEKNLLEIIRRASSREEKAKDLMN